MDVDRIPSAIRTNRQKAVIAATARQMPSTTSMTRIPRIAIRNSIGEKSSTGSMGASAAAANTGSVRKKRSPSTRCIRRDDASFCLTGKLGFAVEIGKAF